MSWLIRDVVHVADQPFSVDLHENEHLAGLLSAGDAIGGHAAVLVEEGDLAQFSVLDDDAVRNAGARVLQNVGAVGGLLPGA